MGFPPDLVSVTTQQRSVGDTRERSTETVIHFAELRSPTNLSNQFISFCVVPYTTRREESSRKRVAHQCRLTFRIRLCVLWLSCEFPHLDLLVTFSYLDAVISDGSRQHYNGKNRAQPTSCGFAIGRAAFAIPASRQSCARDRHSRERKRKIYIEKASLEATTGSIGSLF